MSTINQRVSATVKCQKPFYGLRKITIKIDGEEFDSFDKVELNPKWVHHQAVHYSRTTRCALGITKKLHTAGNWKDITCPDCLTLHVDKLSKELRYFENILDEVRV